MDHETYRMHYARLREETDSLRVYIQALCHDLEATRRERDAAIKRADMNAALARLYLEDIEREAEGDDDDRANQT